jgi:hypothetical protein
MSLRLQPVRVKTGCDDIEGHLVFRGDFLVALLVRLSDEHAEDAGKWFLERGFGRADYASPPLFADLDEAQTWITWRLSPHR